MRARLLKIDSNNTNQKSLDVIERALFAVCLETYATSDDVDVSHRTFFHGQGGRNRWFDKSWVRVLLLFVFVFCIF